MADDGSSPMNDGTLPPEDSGGAPAPRPGAGLHFDTAETPVEPDSDPPLSPQASQRSLSPPRATPSAGTPSAPRYDDPGTPSAAGGSQSLSRGTPSVRGTPSMNGASSAARGARATPSVNGTPSARGGGFAEFGSPGSEGRSAGIMGTPYRQTPILPRGDLGSRGRRYMPGARAPTPASEFGGSQGFPDSPAPDTAAGTTYIWGTDIDINECKWQFRRFMKDFKDSPDAAHSKYGRILEETVAEQSGFMNIDMADVLAFNAWLYRITVRYPVELIPIYDDVIKELAAFLDDHYARGLILIRVRPYNLRDKVNMRELDPSDIDQLVSIKGMVIRCSAVTPELKYAYFKCLVCGHSPDLVHATKGRIQEPTVCARPECAAKQSMSLIHNRCCFGNKQTVRLQETPDAIPEGETPHTVTLCFFDKLVDVAKPGDRVEITGVFRAAPVRSSPIHRTLKSLYRTYVDAVHVKKSDENRMQAEDPFERDATNENFTPFCEGDVRKETHEEKIERLKRISQESDIYEKLMRSVAPSIWELDDIKKGLLCQLFGGTTKKFENSANGSCRGDINILLCGDPGTSKSQLLQYVHKLAPRGIYTSGRGSSAVGLTAYVTKDPETREMVLESGALVLSDRGICCIDEFDKMSDNARSMLHEVMEQQTVSVAKAGIIATLNARTSVLASANPSGSRYNPRLSVIDNIQLPPTLLSRFDLIYLVLDKPDEHNDRRLARHLVALHYDVPEVHADVDILDTATLTSYITYARQHVHPVLGDDAAEDLTEAYLDLRRLGGNKKVITATPRQLESLIRLSESLARMRFSDTVESLDVKEALRLLRVAMQQAATDPTTGAIDMDLITTGVSASERSKRGQLTIALRNWILDNVREGSGPMRVSQVFDNIKQQSSVDVSAAEVREALAPLATEGLISIQGDSVRRLY
ncbi:DNA replication licensing factor MCM4 component [Klebsormidium nitens]|uniref:DNA replication licensing factor MCM4 n=1 Tax=Klebsormidium nitens TaxID=105231 RepID=A0A1Y1HLU8_KLENI|nr:DNA replication licensing factor MCM4 component [Klebsormidium nitens]|eukprot:GAQ79584.1 DNA replication licensing factor MCM4 component [Klebsormidium nitens]